MLMRIFFFTLTAVVLTACANTSLIDSWQDESNAHQYQHLLIIGISDSQQTRRIYEKYFVAELKKTGIAATPSYQLINSKQKINRETVVRAIEESSLPIDAVLVSYLVLADTEVRHTDSPMNLGYSGLTENNQISDTIVSNRGQSRTEEVFVLKSDLYDVQSKSMVWSAQTKTVGPESVDEVVTDVTGLLIDELQSDNLIKSP